ncbi:hypothetical protein TWF694_010902 [Orbilia ellipsospora]|uniref:Uncharacterized protein n=1 Tax=Orbilia ellipsospora TaxID=2528407 RepID=A0AAV9X8D2_9PEZI
MADAPDTKLPTVIKLSPKVRLLSYKLRDEVTAPAQYYPFLLPPTGTQNTNGTPGRTSDRSIIAYGTKTGITILYPKRSRPREQGPKAHQNGETTQGVINNFDYESYSESEDKRTARNIRFPWKYSIDLGNSVTEIAFPSASSVIDHEIEAEEPWCKNLYISAITEDGVVHLISLPLSLPPPGVFSNNHPSPKFPVHMIALMRSTASHTQLPPQGLSMDLMYRVATTSPP